jgi:hypothetical protein
MICPQCRHRNGHDAIYCSDCGYNLESFETAASILVAVGIMMILGALVGTMIFGYDSFALAINVGIGIIGVAIGIAAFLLYGRVQSE